MNTDNTLFKNCALAVVIYGRKLSLCNVYKTFIKPNADKIGCLLVFDNSPTSNYEDIPLVNGIYHYFWDKSNPGLSIHYNQAAQFAADKGYDWLLLLDDDTFFPSSAIDKYEAGVSMFPHERLFVPKHKIANGKYLSPAHSFRRLCTQVETGRVSLSKYDVINSGMLVLVDDFMRVGGYKVEVSLDFSDFQFVDRLRTSLHSMVVLDIECIQEFSNEEKDITKVVNRYKQFCNCFLHFETDRLRCRMKIAYLVIRHTLALTVKFKSVEFLSIFLKTLCRCNV